MSSNLLMTRRSTPPVVTRPTLQTPPPGRCPYCGGRIYMKQKFHLETPVLMTEEQFNGEQTAKILKKAG